MLFDAKNQFRSALLSIKLQPTLLTPHPGCAATAPSCISVQRSQGPSGRQISSSTSARPIVSFESKISTKTRPGLRHASTQPVHRSPPDVEHVSNPDPTLSYAAPITSPQDPNASSTSRPSKLTWNEFLNLRKTRRRYNLVASMCTSFATTSLGVSVIARQDIEHAGLFGLDPFIVLGLATAGSGAVGWLMGPFLGEKVWGWRFRGLRQEIGIKEKDLYRRIQKHRVDPSSSSAGNPVPDYYGEKIGSVAEYRTWLKDQNAYRKKRENFFR